MVEKIRNRINKITKAVGLEITLLADRRFAVSMVVLVQDKKTIVVAKKQQCTIETLDGISEFVEKGIPVYITLNGRGILHKKISIYSEDVNIIVQSVLPNAKASDFYVQEISSEKDSLVSIVRRETVDPIVEAFKKMGVYPIGISLGGINIISILPLISEKSNSFQWDVHSVELDSSGTIVEYKTIEGVDKQYIRIGTEQVEEKYLLAYTGAFNLILNTDSVKPFVESITEQKGEFLGKQLFTKAGWTVLVTFLVVLLINFVLYSNYSTRNNELIQKEQRYSGMFSEMEKLEKEVKQKEDFLSEAGWLQSSSMTYYADQIAATVPPSVRLTELSINPLDEQKSKEEKKELFKTGFIQIKGECSRPTELNEWLDKIKSIEQVSKARLVHYVFDDKTNKGIFSIEIES